MIMFAEQTKYIRGRDRIVPVIVVALFLFFLPGCSEEPEKQVVPVPPLASAPQPPAVHSVFQSVSALGAQELLKRKEGLLLVDVRTPQEIKQMRIAGSLPVPVGDVIRGKFKPAKDRPIMLICAIGGRSYIAGKAMTAMGYQEVYNLDGGIEAWHRAGLPVER